MIKRIFANYILILLSFLFVKQINSFSGCDDVNVFFLIDTYSIINDNNNTINQFIKSIIWDGSSEHTAFSVILYGNYDNNTINTTIISLMDNYNITQRQIEQDNIIQQLDITFEKIRKDNENPNNKSVSLMNAFKIAETQLKPHLYHKKTERLLGNYSIGLNDGENVYFIFDYYGKLIDINNENDLCYLLNKKNESVHFLFGSEYDTSDIFCGDNYEYPHDLIDETNTFFQFNTDLLTDTMAIEIIYNITCPSVITIPQYNGSINLGNHIQWIDIDTIINCNLTLDPSLRHIAQTIKLDTNLSYILVKDYVNDDNTFKIDDYLLSYPQIETQLKLIGCWVSAFKIKDILMIDENENEDYNILKLFVSLPTTLFEYILNANVEGVDVEIIDNNHNDSNSIYNNTSLQTQRRRSLLFWNYDAEDTLSLWNLSSRHEWKYNKTGSMDIISFGDEPKFTLSGDGTITITAGRSIDCSMKLYFKFEWDFFSFTDIYIKFYLTIDWSVQVWFDAEFIGTIVVEIEKLLSFGQYFSFWIGPVPVIMKPFIQIDAKLETIPIRVYTGFECYYGETYIIGYEYEQKWVWAWFNSGIKTTQNEIHSRSPHENNQCTKTFDVSVVNEDDDDEDCPQTELGFDVQVSLMIGVNLYSFIVVYAKGELVVPLRINVPEFNDTICDYASSSCSNTLLASFYYGPMDLSFYFGYWVGFDLGETIEMLIGGGDLDIDDFDIDILDNEHLIDTIEILPKTSLGCITLNGIFSTLNTYYKQQCCDDYYLTTIQPTPSPTLSDDDYPLFIQVNAYASSGQYWFEGQEYNDKKVWREEGRPETDERYIYWTGSKWKIHKSVPSDYQFAECYNDNLFECNVIEEDRTPSVRFRIEYCVFANQSTDEYFIINETLFNGRWIFQAVNKDRFIYYFINDQQWKITNIDKNIMYATCHNQNPFDCNSGISFQSCSTTANPTTADPTTADPTTADPTTVPTIYNDAVDDICYQYSTAILYCFSNITLDPGNCYDTTTFEITDEFIIEFDLKMNTLNGGGSDNYIHIFDIGNILFVRYGETNGLYLRYYSPDGSLQDVFKPINQNIKINVNYKHKIGITQTNLTWQINGISALNANKQQHETGNIDTLCFPAAIGNGISSGGKAQVSLFKITTSNPTTFLATTPSPTTDSTDNLTATNTSTSADVVAICDQDGTYYVSRDNGITYTEIASDTIWNQITEFTVDEVDSNTILKYKCKNVEGKGGVVSTIYFNGKEYYTTDPIDDGYFETDEQVLENYQRDDVNTDGLNENSYWIWNGKEYNTMEIYFNFSRVLKDDDHDITTVNPTTAHPTIAEHIDNGAVVDACSLGGIIATLSCSSTITLDPGYCYNTTIFELTDRFIIEFDLTMNTLNGGNNGNFIHIFDIGNILFVRYGENAGGLYLRYYSPDGSLQDIMKPINQSIEIDVSYNHKIEMTQINVTWEINGISALSAGKQQHETGNIDTLCFPAAIGNGRLSGDKGQISNFKITTTNWQIMSALYLPFQQIDDSENGRKYGLSLCWMVILSLIFVMIFIMSIVNMISCYKHLNQSLFSRREVVQYSKV